LLDDYSSIPLSPFPGCLPSSLDFHFPPLRILSAPPLPPTLSPPETFYRFTQGLPPFPAASTKNGPFLTPRQDVVFVDRGISPTSLWRFFATTLLIVSIPSFLTSLALVKDAFFPASSSLIFPPLPFFRNPFRLYHTPLFLQSTTSDRWGSQLRSQRGAVMSPLASRSRPFVDVHLLKMFFTRCPLPRFYLAVPSVRSPPLRPHKFSRMIFAGSSAVLPASLPDSIFLSDLSFLLAFLLKARGEAIHQPLRVL